MFGNYVAKVMMNDLTDLNTDGTELNIIFNSLKPHSRFIFTYTYSEDYR